MGTQSTFGSMESTSITASRVSDDPMALMSDDRVVDGEVRWRTIGFVEERYLLLVAHTYEEDGEEVVRIISAREATAHERREYEGDL
jgi:uncharacterized DUF497 family protein